MSTRSNVGIINADGSVTAIYIHSDGYPSGVGQTLLTHWNTEEKVRALLALGDLSSLGEVIGEKHNFDWEREVMGTGFDFAKCRLDPRYVMCKAYGRDRGEKDVAATWWNTIKDACVAFDHDYSYLFNPAKGTWSFKHWDGPFKRLTAKACVEKKGV